MANLNTKKEESMVKPVVTIGNQDGKQSLDLGNAVKSGSGTDQAKGFQKYTSGKSLTALQDPLKMKKIMRIIGVGVLAVIVILLIMSIVVRYSRKNKEAEVSPGVGIPTTAPFPNFIPSVYAEDATVKKLEEDINVLVREMQTFTLKESTLSLPVLDFKITF